MVVIRCPLCTEAMQLVDKREEGALFQCGNCARTFRITMLDGSGNLDNEDSLSGDPNDAEKFPPEDEVLHFCNSTDDGTACSKPLHEVANVVLMDGVALLRNGLVRVGGRGRMLKTCDTCCDHVPSCPFCESHKPPVANSDDPDPRHARLNPAKCPDCGGVSGYEDWGP